jgi:hypothetical protein
MDKGRMAMWRYLLTAGLLVSMLSFARAGERLQEIFVAGKRPAGLYTSTSQFQPTACQPILDSLNKEFAIADDRLDDYPRAAVVPDLLLTSDLELPWQRKLVRQPAAEVYKLGRVDFAPAYLEGRSVIFYRRTFEIHGKTIGDLPVNSLKISSERLKATSTDQPVEERDLRMIQGAEILMNIERPKHDSETANVGTPRDLRSLESQQVLLNMVNVGGAPLILAIDAVDAEVGGPHSGSQIDLYVLRLHSAADIRVACHFLGR